MAVLELEERETVEKFGEFCNENNNYLQYFEQSVNPYKFSPNYFNVDNLNILNNFNSTCNTTNINNMS